MKSPAVSLLCWILPAVAVVLIAEPIPRGAAGVAVAATDSGPARARRELVRDAYLANGPERLQFWNGPVEVGREFYFTRAFYHDTRWDGFRSFPSWLVDFPKADRQFMIGLKRLVNHLDAYDHENPIPLTDPDLRLYPFLYAVEVGHMRLNEAEVQGLRSYLLAGGFLLVDDFWGTQEWRIFEHAIRQVLPEYPIVEIPLEHEVFHSFYDVEEIVQVPNVGNGVAGVQTWEKDGIIPSVHGIFDDQGRLLVAINFNCDLGDAWEWAENPYYPLEFSTYAYQMGVNMIVYAMSH